MAEQTLWIAKCKLRGMNQRVGIVYDDQTLQMLSFKSVGRGIGTLNVKARWGTTEVLQSWRLAHKADQFEMIDFRANNLRFARRGQSLQLPDNFFVRASWMT